LADGDEEDDGDEGADASADAATDAAAAAGGQAGGNALDASTAGSAGQQQQLGRADSAADSSAYWSSLLKPRWDVLQRDELEGLELLQVRAALLKVLEGAGFGPWSLVEV
jgi:hypothetical protein